MNTQEKPVTHSPYIHCRSESLAQSNDNPDFLAEKHSWNVFNATYSFMSENDYFKNRY